tara:strand:- start:116 stop:514 length:399 start_codon:yes stop_codon:yes gene_type:complete
MMSETNLRVTLDNHLYTMPDSPPVQWEGKLFKPSNTIYLSQSLIPAEAITVGQEAGGSDVLAGIYQVVINMPKDTDRNIWLVEFERVKARFVRNTTLIESGTRVVITKVWSSPLMTDGAYSAVPISIRYRAV